MFKRRIGPDIHRNGPGTASANGCPDIWELESGDIAVIGVRVTDQARASLPPGAGCAPDEEIVVLPCGLLLDAKADSADLK